MRRQGLFGQETFPTRTGDEDWSSLTRMTDPHPATLELDELLKRCTESRTRRSGPGGQHRNRVETAVILKHSESGVSAEANERRSHADNRVVAIFRLRINLALKVRTVAAPDDRPSDLWQLRTRQGRLSVNPSHTDFPALLAEALDRLSGAGWDTTVAAERSGITTSQLVRFLKHESRAFTLLNDRRRELGLRPLR